MKLGIILLSFVCSFLLVVALLIAIIVCLKNIRIFKILFNKVKLLYAILYIKTLKFFGIQKLIRLFSIKLELNEETTLLEALQGKDLVLPTSTKQSSNPQKPLKNTSKKKRKRDSLGRFTK